VFNYILVFVGGGLGSICRYAISHYMFRHHLDFPLATLIANALACIVLGVLFGVSLKEGGLHANYKFLFMTGFCGGFSTFSTFSHETVQLFQNGNTFLALANILLSLVVCLFCIWAGMKLV
jgi:CrcB protein